MKISETISEWYKKNKRNLPWRETNDPFKIWVSEIILQQTRVDQGLNYYLRFIERFPSVQSLAAAEEQEVIKLWQGLGYYSRARNLHFAARQVCDVHGGIFPTDYARLLKLKGVGPYTAAAIASFSKNEAVALVDGNVSRVLSRLFAIHEPINSGTGEKLMWKLAGEILDRNNPGEHNQGMMEFGALQCVPVNPDCMACPLSEECQAFMSARVQSFPVKQKKSKVKERYFTYLIIRQKGNTYINKRRENDIWKEMYEFPLIEHSDHMDMVKFQDKLAGFALLEQNDFSIRRISKPVKHLLTHRTIHAQFVHLDILSPQYTGQDKWISIPFTELDNFPLPRLIDRYLEGNGRL